MPHADMKEDTHFHVPEPDVQARFPVVEKAALRQSSCIKSEPVLCGFCISLLGRVVSSMLSRLAEVL